MAGPHGTPLTVWLFLAGELRKQQLMVTEISKTGDRYNREGKRNGKKMEGRKMAALPAVPPFFCRRFFCLKVSERLVYVKREFLARMVGI